MIYISLEKRLRAFYKLGLFFKYFNNNLITKVIDDSFYEDFKSTIRSVEKSNHGFILPFVLKSLDGLSFLLDKNLLDEWVGHYCIGALNHSPKKVGVVMAGNIPFVGFHDLLSVLITGNILCAKFSSKDDLLMTQLVRVLIAIEPLFEHYIVVVDKLAGFDAIIATGSNNTSRYFDYYFGKYPNIIRRNRNSIAVITGNETNEELIKLGDDIFLYLGLGCRNVSKVFIPAGFDISKLFVAFDKYSFLQKVVKYMNNYDYYKSIYLLNQILFLENEFVILKEDDSLHSPLSVVFYQYFTSMAQVRAYIGSNADLLQCVVSSNAQIDGSVAFGSSQMPGLFDYADGVDTVSFLLGL